MSHPAFEAFHAAIRTGYGHDGPRTLVSLLDPSQAPARRIPRDDDGLITAAQSSWVVPLDNVSKISASISDTLCRAATGEADVRRRLYTDAQLTVFAYRRVIILNGIELGAVRDDLGDRFVSVRLDRIAERGRRLEDDLQRELAAARPRLLGGLLDLTVRVLSRLPDIHLEQPPRMADFGRILAAVDQIMDTDGLTTYRNLRIDIATDAAAGDPVLITLPQCIEGEFQGTSNELLKRLNDAAEPTYTALREWPKTPIALTGVLRRRGPSLRALGWRCDDLGSANHLKTVRWWIVPPTDGG